MSATRILELASMIATSTAAVNDYLTSQNLPSPSFDVDIPPRLVLEAKIAEHRQAILEATSELHALMQGPIEIITGLSVRSGFEPAPGSPKADMSSGTAQFFD